MHRRTDIEPVVGRWAAMLIAFVVVTLIAWGIWQVGEQLGSKTLRAGLLSMRKRGSARGVDDVARGPEADPIVPTAPTERT